MTNEALLPPLVAPVELDQVVGSNLDARLPYRVCAGLAVCLALTLCTLLAIQYRQAETQAALDVSNLNNVLEIRLENSIHDIQSGLQNIALHLDNVLQKSAGEESVQPQQLHSLTKRFPVIARFDVLSLDGQFQLNSEGGRDAADDEFRRFRASLSSQASTGIVPSFLVMDGDLDKRQLYLAVPVLSDAQRQLGWVASSQSLTRTIDMLGTVAVGPNGIIALRRTDRPEADLRIPPPSADNHSPNQFDEIDRQVAQGFRGGIVQMRSRVDGITRLYGFKSIGDLPLVLVVGLAAEDYLRNWNYIAIGSSTISLALYLLIVYLIHRLHAARIRRQQMMETLRTRALHDELTDLPNRRYLLARVNNAINGCGSVRPLALLYFDVDNFKTFNDLLGHLNGDAILQCLGQRLASLKPSVDTVARLSGDEFLVLVDENDPILLARLVERILSVIHEPLALVGNNLSVSCSAGIACYPSHGRDFGELLKAADTALQQAKRNGRNTWVFYEPTMGARDLRFVHVHTELREAMEKEQLTVHYQPKVDLGTGKVIGAEALLRWNHPEEGLIAPGEFIAVAEATGLIIPISRWLLRQVCHQAIAWQASGFGDLTVAMNASAMQFYQGSLVEDVDDVLRETGLKPHLLELELTESVLIVQSERVLETVRNLKSLGVTMSIDDFGTGYSSMAYLKQFKVDKLKIDQAFVRGVLSNPQDAAIVHAVITLGHSFGMKVIAEGVENFEIIDALIVRGCDEAQGFYYSKALSPDAFESFMKNEANLR